MKILGLTGSIGMGKSYIANIFKQMKIPVFEADEYIAFLLNQSDVQEAIKREIPLVFEGDKLLKRKLSDLAFSDIKILKKLEHILYPKLNNKINKFINNGKAKGEKIIVLEIPLLFENNYDKLCDNVMIVSASLKTQQKRVLSREGMTIKKFNIINKVQMSDKEKRLKADYVVNTEEEENIIRDKVDEILYKVLYD
jgi:dephospho-CoA kinase